MAKHFLEDMVRAKRLSQEQKKEPRKEFRKEPEIKKEVTEELVGETDYVKSRSRYMLWFVAFISVTFFLFSLSFLFSRAEVTVNPKTKDITLNENLSANKDSSSDTLPFDLVIISGEENKNIQANGEKDVAESATSTVVIYNTFGYSSQGLDIDTRLEGSNGKIYKTQTKTVVPGMNKDGTPGSVEVKIYGAEAGQEYNSAPLDFKIFGFKGTPKYSKFYARSKGEITGGFKGKAPVIYETDEANAISDLKIALKAKLLQKATDYPSEVILFKDAVFLNTNDFITSSVYNKDNSVTLTMKGTLYGFLFNEQKLTQKIAEKDIEKYDGSEVFIPNIRDLTFTLTNKDDVSFSGTKNIDFNLSGPAKIVWKLDVDKFTTDLLGKSKKDFNQILLQYPNIDSATLTLRPLWKMSIPDKIKDIKVLVNYPK